MFSPRPLPRRLPAYHQVYSTLALRATGSVFRYATRLNHVAQDTTRGETLNIKYHTPNCCLALLYALVYSNIRKLQTHYYLEKFGIRSVEVVH